MSWETVDALGSILGGVFGGCAFFATLILLVHEIRTRRAAEEDEQARQARLIVSAITKESYPLNTGNQTLHLEGTVRNHSDMPVFNLVVALEAVGAGQEGFRILEPGESVTVKLVLHLSPGNGSFDLAMPRNTGLSLHFLDGNGRHWHRKGSDQPRRVLSGARSQRVPIERFRSENFRPGRQATPDTQSP